MKQGKETEQKKEGIAEGKRWCLRSVLGAGGKGLWRETLSCSAENKNRKPQLEKGPLGDGSLVGHTGPKEAEEKPSLTSLVKGASFIGGNADFLVLRW